MAHTYTARPDLGQAWLDKIGDTFEYVLDVDWCREVDARHGFAPAEHADPSDYSRDDLLDMLRYTACPLHLHPEYPDVPHGVWQRDVDLALDRLDAITRSHLGQKPGKRRANAVPDVTATSHEMAEVLADHPHFAWWWGWWRNANPGLVAVTEVAA